MKLKQYLTTEAAKKIKPIRFEIGKKVSKSEREQILKNMGDVYKDNHLELIVKGVTPFGEEILGYPHRPDLFVKSDITGAMLRFYIYLPDGSTAHPSELFPNITRVVIDKEMERRKAEEAKIEFRRKELLARAKNANNIGDANYQFNAIAKLGKLADDSTVYKKGNNFIRVPNEDIAKGAFKLDHEILKKEGFKLILKLKKGNVVFKRK